MTSTPDDELPTAEQIAYIANQIDELRQLGVTVRILLQPLPPGVIGTLSQLLPDGPMTVLVDPTKALRFQSHMLVLAFEFIFNEPDAEWDVIDTVHPDGTPLHFRTIRIRVEDDGTAHPATQHSS